MEIKSNKYWNFPLTFCILFSVFVFAHLFFVLALFWENYLVSCPNKDFLTWDPSLRLIQTIQMMDHLRNFQIWTFFYQILDSPTWPVFRNLFQIPYFFLFGVLPANDIPITFGTLGLLLLATGVYLYIEIPRSIKFFAFPVFFLSATTVFLQSQAITIYTFSGMLEIQGALFFILSVLSISIYYKKNHPKSKWLVLFSGLMLFHTKYPYGYMFLLSVLFFQVMISPKNFIDFFLRYLQRFFSNKINISIFLFILILACLYVLPFSFFAGKAKKSIKFGIFILLSFHFVLYFYRNKNDLISLGYEKLIFLFQWVVFPVLFWVMIHPDRFSSSGSTIAHVQSEGLFVGQEVSRGLSYYSIYIKEIVTNMFETPLFGILTISALIFSIGRGYFDYRKNSTISSSFVLSFLSFCPVIFLTFLTSNHQVRHIFHLIPVFTLCVFVLASEHIAKLSKFFQAFLIGFIYLFAVYNSISLNSFAGTCNVCFAGSDRSAYKLPLEVKHILEKSDQLKNPTILLNDLNPIHVNRADVELIFNIIAYKNRVKVITNPKTVKKILDYKNLFFVGNDCSGQDSMKKFEEIAKNQYQLLEKEKFVSENLCMIHYELISK